MTIPATDPLGLSAQRVALNAKLASLGIAISGWTGDVAGRRDLQMQACSIADRLNLSSTLTGTAVDGVGIGGVST